MDERGVHISTCIGVFYNTISHKHKVLISPLGGRGDSTVALWSLKDRERLSNGIIISI